MIDFSSNLHPSPPPERLLQAAKDSIAGATRYPEVHAESLRAAFADILELLKEQILFGPGSSSLLYQILLFLRPKSVVLPTPCFSEYPHVARLAGARVFEQPASQDPLPPHSCVIVSNPCNPTGRVFPIEDILPWMLAARKAEGWMIVDEAYADFRENGPEKITSRMLDDYPLIVLRSPLKFFSLPGLRSGMAFLPPGLAGRFDATIPPWPLSAPALAATAETLRLTTMEIRGRRRALRNWADTFKKALRSVPQIAVSPSDMHYFLIRLPDDGPSGEDLAQRLAKAGLWIRTSAGMPGLTPRDIRVSTRFPEENGKLIAALKKIYNQPVANPA